jgi:uncharacterized protein with GYD domain
MSKKIGGEAEELQTFIFFGTYNSQSLKNASAGRTKRAINLIAGFGGKVHSIYAILGDYDLVMIASLPGLEAAMQVSVALTRSTGISFKTSPAVPADRFDDVIMKS